MSLIYGNPLVGINTDDNTEEQEQLPVAVNCNGSMRVAPCGSFDAISGVKNIPDGTSYDSGVILLPQNAKWDVVLNIVNYGGGTISYTQAKWYIDPDETSYASETIFDSTNIVADGNSTRYGVNLDELGSVQVKDTVPFMFKACQLVVGTAGDGDVDCRITLRFVPAV